MNAPTIGTTGTTRIIRITRSSRTINKLVHLCLACAELLSARTPGKSRRVENLAQLLASYVVEKYVHAAAEKINLRIEAAEGKIREAVASARSEIEAVAADATREMVARLTGIQLNPAEAAAAVKDELHV